MRFFEKIQFDVHNLAMATDRHQAPSYPLRMPDEMKAKISATAAASGRSLHAELLFRLEESFRLTEDDAELARTRIQLKESRLRESIVQGEALFLSYCVDWLFEAAEMSGAVFEKDAAKLSVDAKATAKKVKSYEHELNPELRLEEFRKTIEEVKAIAYYWAPKARPWPGATVQKKPRLKKSAP